MDIFVCLWYLCICCVKRMQKFFQRFGYECTGGWAYVMTPFFQVLQVFSERYGGATESKCRTRIGFDVWLWMRIYVVESGCRLLIWSDLVVWGKKGGISCMQWILRKWTGVNCRTWPNCRWVQNIGSNAMGLMISSWGGNMALLPWGLPACDGIFVRYDSVLRPVYMGLIYLAICQEQLFPPHWVGMEFGPGTMINFYCMDLLFRLFRSIRTIYYSFSKNSVLWGSCSDTSSKCMKLRRAIMFFIGNHLIGGWFLWGRMCPLFSFSSVSQLNVLGYFCHGVDVGKRASFLFRDWLIVSGASEDRYMGNLE